MKPSDVDLLRSFPPLIGTMGRSEAEAVAALMVLALAANGDEWRPISRVEVGDHFRALIAKDEAPWARLANNPFWRPLLAPLLEEKTDSTGFRYYLATEDEEGRLSFTFAGLLALSKYRRPDNLATLNRLRASLGLTPTPEPSQDPPLPRCS